MGAIFLSYSREDRASADALIRVLEEAGHSVWWDRHLESGEEFAAEIEAELDKAEVVLVAWSKESVKSRWVRDEAAAGGDTGRLVPVSIDGSLPPMGFRQIHTLDLKGWRGGKRDERTADLLHAIQRRLNGKDDPARPGRSARAKTGPGWVRSKRSWGIAAAVALLIVIGTVFFATRYSSRNAPLKPTFALLPLKADSSDPELRQLASQSRDSIARTFFQNGVPVRLVDAIDEKTPSAADFTITGDLSRSADKLIATVRLDEVKHGATVYSKRFEAGPEESKDLPERIGVQLAGDLTWASTMLILDRRKPLDPALIADLFQGGLSGAEALQGYQSSKRVAAKAPDNPNGYIGVAFNTAFALSQLPTQERARAVAEARHAADRALQLAPGFGDTYATWCLLHSETRRAECEDRLRAGRKVDPDAPFLNTFLSHLMRDVGRFQESSDLARLAYTHDIYFGTKIAWMLKTLEFSGQADEARDLYRQGLRWWPEMKPMFFRNRLFGLIERGDFDGIRRLEKEVGPEGLPPDYRDSAALARAVKAKSIPAARRACGDSGDHFLLDMRCMIALSALGDQDGAYRIADKGYPNRLGRNAAETERIWLDDPEGAGALEFITSPAAARMRRDPRFLPLAERTGLLAYWRSGRMPDFCSKQPEPICAQLKRR